ncbi:hypothetical protein EDB92DRAFT_1946707 [Lactarius akahatsu]|uniref:Xylanolytic transcriptional activator regulatory domain-containing protein n=1 Tax=Lactarius akahatsu TaxID=416441 RepID=A0AAD4LFQ5_9AGAM|nr:hypothetical protein EDB92DRAFT_1946707 [Lactarius akahatsu]
MVSGTGVPPLVAVAPKKQGRKPKQTATVADNLPVSGAGATTKTPGPMRDPLPLREGRNTHPSQRDGVQPPPCRSSQEVAAERSRKRLELEEKLRIAEEAKHMLAQMELEDERFVEGIEEECCQPHDHQQQRKALTIVESDDEEIQGIDEVNEIEDDNKKDDDDNEGEDKGTVKAKVKAKCKGVKASKTKLRKEINAKVAMLQGARGQNNTKPNGGIVKFSPTDLKCTQYTEPEAEVANTKTTTGHVIDEVTIGGLDDSDIELAGLASHTIAEFLEDKDDTDTNRGPNIAQTKLKTRATVQAQGVRNPSMGLVYALGPEHFVLQRTWAKVFLPSLMYQVLISKKGPFQDFTNNSPTFVTLIQEAFNATHPSVSYTVAAGDAIVATRSLIASEALKHVKKYFEGDRFKDRPEDVKNHVWWALHPDGLAYQAFPTPIDCPFDHKSPQYIFPEGRYQSDFIVPVVKKYITLTEGSAILPQLGAENLPIGSTLADVLVAVEHAFKTFVKGTYKDPPQFSNENTWRSINDFRESLLCLDTERWDQVLRALGPSDVLGADLDAGLSTLSAYQGDLKLAQCDAILKHHIPGFELENLEEILSVPRLISSNGPVPDIKGGDPGFHDMLNPWVLAKSFSVAPDIVQALKLRSQPLDKEDIVVGSHGLIPRRDNIAAESAFPHDANKWVLFPMRRDSIASSPSTPGPTHTFSAFLPKDCDMVQHIVHIYFERLNASRSNTIQYPSELNHRTYGLDGEAKNKATTGGTPALANRALSIKPELRVTICSLQALILLDWYLYTEHQGCMLWRLCGSIVRLGMELGLNHDPTTQTIFDEPKCQLHIRLWGIVLIYDRGTSLLLGHLLAIAPYDSNTPHPVQPKSTRPDLSEHFLLSYPITGIQAGIINSLYSLHGQSGDAIMCHVMRIVKSMVEFRRHLPEKYKRGSWRTEV